MRKNIRDTIRRPKDYEREASWDSNEAESYSEEIGEDDENDVISDAMHDKEA